MKTDTMYTKQIAQARAGVGESNEFLRAFYLDWFNNFLTVGRFCEHYEIEDINVGRAVINLGRILHEEYCTEQHKKRMG